MITIVKIPSVFAKRSSKSDTLEYGVILCKSSIIVPNVKANRAAYDRLLFSASK